MPVRGCPLQKAAAGPSSSFSWRGRGCIKALLVNKERLGLLSGLLPSRDHLLLVCLRAASGLSSPWPVTYTLALPAPLPSGELSPTPGPGSTGQLVTAVSATQGSRSSGSSSSSRPNLFVFFKPMYPGGPMGILGNPEELLFSGS